MEQTIINKEKAALDKWAIGDTSGFTNLGAEDVSYFAEGTDYLIEGFEAFKEANEAIMGKVSMPRFEMIDPKVRLFGEIAILTYVLKTYDADDNLQSHWKSTEIYRQFDTDWKLIHSHWTLRKE